MSKLTNLVFHIQAALEGKPLMRDEGMATPLIEEDSCPSKTVKSSEEATTFSLSKKEQVINAILKRGHEVQAGDLPDVEKEMLAYFEKNKNGNYFTDLKSNDYYRFVDLRDQHDTRVVVVGDIHCDYNSLAAILLKLSVSPYNFFEKGIFVFMGDYLDRGAMLFEPLLLLIDLKQILGDRLIMLRGNHELISYNKESQLLESRVRPQDSVPCLNEYCGENKEFLEAFGYFYQTLPTYVYLKVRNQNIMLTHGSIPRQQFLNVFNYDQNTGAITFERDFLYEEDKRVEESITDDSLKTKTKKLNDNLLTFRNKILYDMIWGDPSNDEEKYQVSGRFQFGRKQFEAYVQKNGLTRLFRSHEPVEHGYAPFFDNRLFTIFSTGGNQNGQAGYADVQPAFAIINGNGSFEIENSYIYQVTIGGIIDLIVDLYSEDIIKITKSGHYALNAEFGCTEQDAIKICNLFAKINEEPIALAEEQKEEEDPKKDENEASDRPQESVTMEKPAEKEPKAPQKEESEEATATLAGLSTIEEK